MKMIHNLKRSSIAFLIGAVIGLLILLLMFRGGVSVTLSTILWMPVHPFILLGDKIIYLYCTPKNLCAGLGLDGGTLEWLEWVFIYISAPITYGLLAVFIDYLRQVFRYKKRQ